MNTYRNLNVIMKYVSPHMNFQGKNTKPRLFKNFTKYQEKIMKSRPDFPNHDKIVIIKIKTGGHLVNHIKTDSRYGRKIPNKKYSLDCRFSKSETNSRSEKHFILLQCLYLWLSNTLNNQSKTTAFSTKKYFFMSSLKTTKTH